MYGAVLSAAVLCFTNPVPCVLLGLGDRTWVPLQGRDTARRLTCNRREIKAWPCKALFRLSLLMEDLEIFPRLLCVVPG